MPRFVTSEDIPSIPELFNTGSTCMHPAPSQGFRRCRNPINARDRGEVSQLRENIMSSLNSRTTFIDDDCLRRYAELSCCVRYHRVQVVDKPILEQIVQKWQAELLELRPAPEPVSLQQNGRQNRDISSQRTLQRVTRAHPTGIRISTDRSPLSAPKFVPYETQSTDSMLDILSKPLTELQRKSGSLYCCSRSSDPGFYKHGCTTKWTVTKRVENLQRCSGPTNAVRLEYSVHTANVHRAERLVQHELKLYRRKEPHCLAPSCTTEHKEWLEIDVNIIKRVMSRYALWMNSAKPYDEAGSLREPWRRYCRQLEREDTPITAVELYSAWQQGLVGNVDNVDSDADVSSEEDDSAPPEPEPRDCPVCLEVMREPARTACGHEFCAECIAKVFELSNRCPLCRAELMDGEVPGPGAAEITMQNAASAS